MCRCNEKVDSKEIMWGKWTASWWNTFTTWIILMLLLARKGEAERAHRPKFLDRSTNVTIAKGSVAILKCAVENLGTKTVIWRKQPYKVPITVGTTLFVPGLDRHRLHRVPALDEWNLLIKNAQPYDSGVYECQVSSKGALIRRNITLNVLDIPSKAEITIDGSKLVNKGEPVHIKCNASGTEEPPQSIDWFKDGIKLDSKYHRDLYIQEKVSLLSKTIVSVLDIHKAEMEDTGVYICRASDELAARITVDVLNAETNNEKREAQNTVSENTMGSISASTDLRCSFLLVILTLISSIVITYIHVDCSIRGESHRKSMYDYSNSH